MAAAHHFQMIRLLFGLPAAVLTFLTGSMTQLDIRRILSYFGLTVKKNGHALLKQGNGSQIFVSRSFITSAGHAGPLSLGSSVAGWRHGHTVAGLHSLFKLLEEVDSATSRTMLKAETNETLFSMPGTSAMPRRIPENFRGLVVQDLLNSTTAGILQSYSQVSRFLLIRDHQVPDSGTLPNSALALHVSRPVRRFKPSSRWLAVCFLGGDFCCHGIGHTSIESINAAKLHAAFIRARATYCPNVPLLEQGPSGGELDAIMEDYRTIAMRFGAVEDRDGLEEHGLHDSEPHDILLDVSRDLHLQREVDGGMALEFHTQPMQINSNDQLLSPVYTLFTTAISAQTQQSTPEELVHHNFSLRLED
ncbi:hypothetical protein BCR44DRAFT_81401 [Catenaria anguillulae PL171]|uniref:Uncharacterized protein n=1 Tax=Catenaria anguillulae PL171 TaxID=765915 RepID=A0A1Y2HIJ6_9FUNG|nr:hypothetical protein BCR44DRAFT_81401 [Catenaria anguillulae PL171]